MSKARLVCVECGRSYEAGELYRCPQDGGELALEYDYAAVRNSPGFLDAWNGKGTLWEKYFSLLPVEHPASIVTLGEGNTPLVRSRRVADLLGVRNLYFKLENCNPTGSFKDRQMTVAVSKGNELGKVDYATVSSGNVGNALSAYCAKQGFHANVWVSDGTAEAKYQQIQIYGAQVFLFPDPERNGVDAYNRFFGTLSGYCAKHNMMPMISARPVNPYMIEGSKTISFELLEQLGHVPSCVFSPIGGGGLFGGLWKGFKELRALGLADTLPDQWGVQKEGYMARIVDLDDPKFDSTGKAVPLDGRWALHSLREGRGEHVGIDSNELLEAQEILATHEGVFAEPQGATSFAGLLKKGREGALRGYHDIVCIITGSGLKDMGAAARMIHNEQHYRQVQRVSTFEQCDPWLNAARRSSQ